MMKSFKSLSGVEIPLQIYGTAWKKERTADLVEQAINLGFRGVDTACQPKHYNEPMVGEGIKRSGIERSELFIQTKFTPFSGQDPENCPYDPSMSLDKQLEISLDTSLKNLKTDYLDSLVLHSPLQSWKDNQIAWATLERFVEAGSVKQIGISNCYHVEIFKKFYSEAKIKPSLIQNRFYSDSNYDKDLRTFCHEHGVYYQCFWTVNANRHIWTSPDLESIVQRYKKSPLQVFFRALNQEEIFPLYGTTKKEHMLETLELFSFELNTSELSVIRELAGY